MPPAGQVSIVLSVDKASYTAGLKDAQGQLKALAGEATSAGRSTVGSMQAASASIRALENPLNMNIRTLARFAAQSETAGKIFQAAFPLIGAIAAVAMIAKLGTEISAFVKKVEQMPKAIEQGFAGLNLSQKTTTDELVLSTDKLQASLDKLNKKQGDNGAKIAMDEARVAADKLAESIVNSNNKLNELLSKNHANAFSSLFGAKGTANREGTAKAFARQSDDDAYNLANATPGTPEFASAQRAMAATQQAQLDEAQKDLADRQKHSKTNIGSLGVDDRNNINIDKGVITTILNQRKQAAAEQAAAITEGAKATSDAQRAAAEAAKAADQARLQSMKEALDAEKLQNGMSLKQVFDYWTQKASSFTKGSAAYNDVVKLQSAIAVEGAVKAHQELLQAAKLQKKNGESDVEGMDVLSNYSRSSQGDARKAGQEQTQDYVDSSKLAVDQASNTAKEQEAKLTDEAGKSISRYAAAVQMAQVHAQEWLTVEEALTGILNARKQAAANNPDSKDDAKAVTQAQIELANAQREHSAQMQGDSDNIYGKSSSASAGFDDAINSFVRASQDAASQMNELVTGTLKSLNDTILSKNPDFKAFGAGALKNVASMGLEKAEGGIMGAFGGGKLGTQANPMITKSVDDANGSTGSAISGIFSKLFGGSKRSSSNSGDGGLLSSLGSALGGGDSDSDDSGSGGASGLGSLAQMVIPFLASGGPINGPAIVGENGPELYVPNSSGSIVPNHKLKGVGGPGDIHFHPGAIDARGAHDPAAVNEAVHRGIMAAAPHIMAGSVALGKSQQARRPTSSR